jgi:hypothetical protein
VKDGDISTQGDMAGILIVSQVEEEEMIYLMTLSLTPAPPAVAISMVPPSDKAKFLETGHATRAPVLFPLATWPKFVKGLQELQQVLR